MDDAAEHYRFALTAVIDRLTPVAILSLVSRPTDRRLRWADFSEGLG
jgi:hypothetical protein